MSDLIERLRGGSANKNDLGNRAADEIERLQAQITAMTKDMDSMKPWRELQRENEELRERLESATQACDDLANEMVYHGNSVGWWYSKATAYRSAIERSWDALRGVGVHPDGVTDVADAIRELAALKANDSYDWNSGPKDDESADARSNEHKVANDRSIEQESTEPVTWLRLDGDEDDEGYELSNPNDPRAFAVYRTTPTATALVEDK